MVVYLFTEGADSGKAPIEAILPQAKEMPLYQILNEPLGVLFGNQSVKMANFSKEECLVA